VLPEGFPLTLVDATSPFGKFGKSRKLSIPGKKDSPVTVEVDVDNSMLHSTMLPLASVSTVKEAEAAAVIVCIPSLNS
jgi:hypothetical protein